MVVPFLVGVFWYKQSRVYAAACSMIAGLAATVLWRFGVLNSTDLQDFTSRSDLEFLRDLSPALLGFAVVAFFVALPLTYRLPLGRLFQLQTLP